MTAYINDGVPGMSCNKFYVQSGWSLVPLGIPPQFRLIGGCEATLALLRLFQEAVGIMV